MKGCRIGRKFRRMAGMLPEDEVLGLWARVDGERIYNGFSEKYKLADVMRGRIEEKILPVIEKAKQSGERVRRTWGACGDPSCGICSGKHPNHFHIERQAKDEKDNLELEDWLSKYLSPEEVLAFVSFVRNFENLRVLIHYETILLRNLGLLERGEG